MMCNTLSAITSQCMMRANLVSVITVEPRFSGPLGGQVNWATGKLKIAYLIPSGEFEVKLGLTFISKVLR